MLVKANISWTVKQMIKSIENDTIRFDSYIQRNLVWTNEQKSLLIDSVLNGYPIPPFYANRSSEDKIYYFLDGKQRSNAFSSFVKDEFALDDVVFNDADGNEIDISGKKFSELTEDQKDVILDTSLTIYYYNDLTEDQESDLFFRLNNGSKLTAIQKARANCPSIKMISEIANHPLFVDGMLSDKACAAKINEQLVVQSYLMLTEDEPCLDNKIVRDKMAEMRLTEEDKTKLVSIFDLVKSVHDYIIADDSDETLNKKIAKKLYTRTHMISLTPLFSKVIEENIDEHKLYEFICTFFNGGKSATISDNYNIYATAGSGHVESIKNRLEAIETEWKKFSVAE